MKINSDMMAAGAMKELSIRLKDYRIAQSITRAELADKSFISEGTIKRFENGGDISLQNFIKIVRALGLINNIDLIIPDQTERPSYHFYHMEHRKRARKVEKRPNNWKWGDEE